MNDSTSIPEQPNGGAASPAPSSLATRHSSSTRVFRLARKELREILRDRRTIVTLIAMPLLLYPLMSVAFTQFYLATRDASKEETNYRIGVLTDAEALALKARLNAGARALRQKAGNEVATAKVPELEYLRDRERPDPVDDQERTERLKELQQNLQDRTLDLVVVIPKLGSTKATTDRWLPCQIYSVSNSLTAREALAHIEKLLAAANESDLKSRLDVPGKRPRIMLLSLERITLSAVGSDGVISLAALVPLVLILMTITGAVYPAIDLTAGERERGTLEILVAAPVPRFELLTAKYISVVTVAVLTAVVNLVCMTITLSWSGLGAVLIQGGMSVGLLVQVFALLLLFATFFSAVLLCLTSFARSFKEAQAYLIPLMLASLTPGILAMLPGLELGGVLIVLPLVNVVLLARDLFQGGPDPVTATIVILTTLLYALAALALAARVFGAESVLYNEQSGWSDLVRRPDEPQASATIPAMLWCLALMVPIQFALVALLGSLGPLPPLVGIVVKVAVNLLMFGLIPFVFAHLGRVELRSALGLQMPRPAALCGSTLLGMCLWPFVLWLLSELHDPAQLEKKYAPVLAELSAMRARAGWWMLITVIVPAILEEIFFRGLLFNALKARAGPLVTIGASAILFGLTHVMLPGSFGLERLIPSTLLGLVLGTVCWHTGSLWPSMIMHVLHNSMVLGIGLYDADATNHVRWDWLAGGAAGALVGVLLLWSWGRKPNGV